MSVTTVRLQPDVEKSLEDLAKESRRSKGWLINEAVGEYIKHRETEQMRWEGTLQAVESVARGKVVSDESVHAWLESWGTADEPEPPKVGE